ncbi:MAG: alanine--tRNA ligase [Candidatus Omnitrophota bacterium]|nr:alanine--tRNA ligase [Candidatus Omnitrophota bacterium]
MSPEYTFIYEIMTSAEIRKRFLEFFENRGHTVVQSDLLVPKNDPTLLFTSAGMNQFKEQFMGKNIRFKRAASCQKCLRTGDLENVGKTPRHHTFFEMLGNFSFGDYFKKEAISWGWEFMTKEMGLAEERLWVSVYEDDDESYDIWLRDIGVPGRKIIKFGAHDNFWPADAPTMGPNGPCGPCSEIFYDWGEGAGCGKKDCNPACDCGRFVEVWNLVFTQFDRRADGRLDPLPSKNIDTGMGMERIASVMQGVKTNFETDLFEPIVEQVKKELGDEAEKIRITDMYLIADHIRAATFAIADGVSPSNEKRGYVVRKLIRRSYLRSGRKGPFLYNIVPKIADVMKNVYPEVGEKREHVSAIIEEEEKRFDDTLTAAMPVMDSMVSEGAGKLEGEQIFKLVDTYGLPMDVIEEEAEKRKIELDAGGFERRMARRKEQSRKGSDISREFIFQPGHFDNAPKPSYSDEVPLETVLEFILKGDLPVDEIARGDCAEVITSPQSGRLYAEAGGQVGDTGSMVKEGARMDILNTFETGGRKVLQVLVTEGSFGRGDRVTLDLDPERKKRTAKNHTATHLLQAALRRVLGQHVRQSGSLVDDKRLRFDFTHMKKLSDREIIKVENMVNAWIGDCIDVCKETKAIQEAKGEGALSFFGEKYGDTVRVVTIGDHSKELCGGTHVVNTGDIKLFKITAESSVASGIRRIEAVTGDNVHKWLKETLQGMLDGLKIAAGNLQNVLEPEMKRHVFDIVGGGKDIDAGVLRDFEERIRPALMEAKKKLERDAKKIRKEEESGALDDARPSMDRFAEESITIGDVNFVSGILRGLGMPLLRKAAGYLEKKIGSGVIILGSREEGKAYLICAVTSDLASKGVDAGDLINRISGKIGGSGGGNPTFAQAGGKNPEGLQAALEGAKDILGSIS